MWRARVIPARKVPLAMGVNTTPSFTMKTLAVAVSATLPIASADQRVAEALGLGLDQHPRVVGVKAARLGVADVVLQHRAAEAGAGQRRRGAAAGGIGTASRQSAKPVAPSCGATPRSEPSSAQYIGRM